MEVTPSKRSNLDHLDTKMSVASSEHRARQAVAAAAHAAQASPSSHFTSPNLEPLSPLTRPAPPPRRRCCSTRAVQEAIEQLQRFAEKYKVREVGLWALGLASLIFLLTAVTGPEPQPFAAVLASLLGWLTIYTYMLQAECHRLTTTLQSIQNRGVDRWDVERVDAEMSHICSAYELLRPGGSQRAVQSVLTASLAHDYLRLQSALRVYAERYGPIAEVGLHWNLDKTLVASVAQAPDVHSHGDGETSAASQVGELPNVHANSLRDVSIESPAPGPAPSLNGPSAPSQSVAETISKTIASIEDSMNLPSWLKQIRH
ncbi:Uncharacterized protein SCF082_LOCUS40602 [Durusdinium trenchii]|uniref:SMODS and SLOG-associating 2TM effector domain-containing protein n=1 Tax=Durusdinium trenchii TaxID=1381693 RepID=A0ABP0QCY7_9DINO